VLYAGKAHPRDEGGKAMIRRVFEAAATLGDRLRVIYLTEYDMALAKLLCAGVDLWLNTPRKPQEASGTSVMKAALNGVPSLSILDGWWVEGHCEGVTGWSIGDDGPQDDPTEEATSLYDKLEYVILPMFFRRPLAYAGSSLGMPPSSTLSACSVNTCGTLIFLYPNEGPFVR
jgi:starch phosphorylase